MNHLHSADATSLRAACYELSMAKDIPDAGLLDDLVRRYPQFGAELTEFAISIAMDALRERAGEQDPEVEEDDAVSPAVSRAMSRFHNRLHAESVKSKAISDERSAMEAPNPFSALSREQFRQVAVRLNTTTRFVMKLRDRQIDPKTITPGFRRRTAQELKVPLDVMNAHFNARRVASAGAAAQFHKADGKPAPGVLQSFEEAVRTSGMSEEQQRDLLVL